MLHTLQLDNPISTYAQRREREKALEALEKAKAIPRKVIFLPKGFCQFKKEKQNNKVLDVVAEHYATDLISIDAAVVKTGYKKPTLQGFFRENKVSGVKIKNKLHFPEEELMTFVAERRARNPVENIRKNLA